MDLSTLGFDRWFQEEQEKSLDPGFATARVAEVNRDSYVVIGIKGEVYAELAGSAIFSAKSSMDFPAVGDWVCVEYHNEGTFAIIHRIYKRKSFLRRKTAGKQIDYQLIAANIDIALIVQSVGTDFNMRRLERYLVMIKEGNIEPVLVLTKTDLVGPEILTKKISEVIGSNIVMKILPISNVTGTGLDQIHRLLTTGKTYCLIGSSGVGKTTLVNHLIGQDLFETGEVRTRDGRGKHITARRQLIVLPNGAMIIDTPGMRELGIIGFRRGIDLSFEDIGELSRICRFSNCNHTSDWGCALRKAIENGKLSKQRYDNYIKLVRESEYHQLSYFEKRQKDRKIGQFIKKTMKHNKKF